MHPNSLLWNANAEADPKRLLRAMMLLRLLWRKLSHAHGLSSECSLLTSFLYNLTIWSHSPDVLALGDTKPLSLRPLGGP